MKLLESKISRRLVIAGTALASMPARAAAQAKPRALALIGDRTHNPNYIRTSLNRVFHALDIPIDYTIDYAGLSAASLKPYQILLILRDGVEWPNGYSGPDAFSDYEKNLENESDLPAVTSIPWITEEQGLAIKNFVSNGGGFYPLHDSSHISLFSKSYRDVMGGAFWGHPPLRPFEVHATQNAHPITAGMNPFIVNDEQHYVDYDKDPRSIILEAENRDGLSFKDRGTKSPVGWAYDYGKGRVVFTAMGHTNHALWNPQYLELHLDLVSVAVPAPRDSLAHPRVPARAACSTNSRSKAAGAWRPTSSTVMAFSRWCWITARYGARSTVTPPWPTGSGSLDSMSQPSPPVRSAAPTCVSRARAQL